MYTNVGGDNAGASVDVVYSAKDFAHDDYKGDDVIVTGQYQYRDNRGNTTVLQRDEDGFYGLQKGSGGNKIINVALTSDIEKIKRGEILEINDVTKEFTLSEDGMSYTKAYDIKEINWVKSKKEEGNVSAKGTLTLTTDGNVLTGANRKITEVMVNGKDFVTPDVVSSLPSGNSAVKVGDKYYGFDADNKWVELVAGANIVTLKDEKGIAQKQYTVESKQNWNIVLNDGVTKYGLNYNEHNYGTDESTLVKNINFDILGINYNGKWYEDNNLNDVLTMPDGSGSLVSVKISDNDGNYLWDAYFALSNGSWVSSYSMKVGNYTAIKNLDTNEWSLVSTNERYSLTSVNKEFRTELTNLKYNGNWVSVADSMSVPDGSGKLAFGDSRYFSKDENGNWVSYVGMNVGNYKFSQVDGTYELRNENTAYSVDFDWRNGKINSSLSQLKTDNNWLNVNLYTGVTDSSGSIIAEVEGGQLFVLSGIGGSWQSITEGENFKAGTYTGMLSNGTINLTSTYLTFDMNIKDVNGQRYFDSKLTELRIKGATDADGNLITFRGINYTSVPGGGSLILGQRDDEAGNYYLYCSVNDKGEVVQIKDGMHIGDFVVSGNSGNWKLNTDGQIAIVNQSADGVGLNGYLTGTFNLGNDDNGFILTTNRNYGIQYTNPNGKNVDVTLLQERATLSLSSGGFAITDGIISVTSGAIVMPPSSKQSTKDDQTGSGEHPDATGTNAVIVEDGEGGYSISNGTVRINNGSLVVMGIGAVFKKDSVIQGQTVKSGSLRIAEFDGNSPIFVSDGNSARARVYSPSGSYYDVYYDQSGVTWAGYSYYAGSKVWQDQYGINYKTSYTTTVSYALDTVKGYQVLKKDSNNNLVVGSVNTSASKPECLDDSTTAAVKIAAYNYAQNQNSKTETEYRNCMTNFVKTHYSSSQIQTMSLGKYTTASALIDASSIKGSKSTGYYFSLTQSGVNSNRLVSYMKGSKFQLQ